jgi:16S rRNA (uracil1498-N3)-methyltransferase
MSLPFFYLENIADDAASCTLSEETSKHVVQVLRMNIGERILLTDGKGKLVTAEITDDHRKRCQVKFVNTESVSKPSKSVQIAISPLKNASRFEWFLEKAAEVGVSAIIPLMCKRTEKQQLRTDRLKGILISAMIQSRQAWLCELCEPVTTPQLIVNHKAHQLLIAHCEEGQKESISEIKVEASVLMLIGPEGDFANEEIKSFLDAGFRPVSLGENRLRTETAGVVAAVKLCIQ